MARPRQYNLSKLIAEIDQLHGLSNRQLAKRLGTSEATIRRTKKNMDNPEHKLLFTLPPIKETGTAIAIVQNPPYPDKSTGDRELDLALWLADCAATGNPELLEEAKTKWSEVLEPRGMTTEVMEKRYANYLAEKGGNAFCGISAFGAFDLDNKAAKTTERNATQNEIVARFGSLQAVLDYQPPELLLLGDNAEQVQEIAWEREGDYLNRPHILEVPELLAIVRDRLPEPKTLDDILREHEYWEDLSTLRYAIDHGNDPMTIVTIREEYIDAVMTQIRPRDKAEAMRNFRWLLADQRLDRMEDSEIIGHVERLFL